MDGVSDEFYQNNVNHVVLLIEFKVLLKKNRKRTIDSKLTKGTYTMRFSPALIRMIS